MYATARHSVKAASIIVLTFASVASESHVERAVACVRSAVWLARGKAARRTLRHRKPTASESE